MIKKFLTWCDLFLADLDIRFNGPICPGCGRKCRGRTKEIPCICGCTDFMWDD